MKGTILHLTREEITKVVDTSQFYKISGQ